MSARSDKRNLPKGKETNLRRPVLCEHRFYAGSAGSTSGRLLCLPEREVEGADFAAGRLD